MLASACPSVGRDIVRTTTLTRGGDAVEFMDRKMVPDTIFPDPMQKLFALAFAAFAAGCAAPPSTPLPATPQRPALVVLLVVDGLPQRRLDAVRGQLAPDGLARFLQRGAWFPDAHFGHAHTVTAPGHAVIATGAYPARTGLVGNEWRNPATGALEYCVADPAHAYIGHETRRHAGTSPKNLRVATVGDVLRAADPAAKVISVAGKDRAAIPLAGHKGTAYVYQSATGQFTSTTYYMKAHPAWVDAFNAAKPADRYLGAEWRPLLPDDAYGDSLPDGQRWFARGGRLPKRAGEDRRAGAAFYSELRGYPFFDQLVLDFARAAVAAEGLGRDASPDILAVGLSSHDHVNHAYGAESRISHDHLLHLDRALQEFLRFLDERVGAGRYVAVLTSDHGFMPALEHAAMLGQVGGRFNAEQAVARLNRALGRFGSGPFVRHISARTVALDRDIAAARGVPFDAVAEEVRRLLEADPGVAAAYTRAELEGRSRAGEPLFDAILKGWHRELSGDVAFVLEPHWTFSNEGITHGSPHPYDTHVPLMLHGPAWIAPGRRDGRVEIADLAPTVAQLLGIPPPPAAEGKPLRLR